MTKISKTTLRITAAVLCIALVLLGGLIGRTRAALLEGNGTDIELGMETLAVQLIGSGQDGKTEVLAESGSTEGVLFADLSEASIDPGYTYSETVAARNSGASPEYVRVIVTKYWKDAEGNKINKVYTKEDGSTVNATEYIILETGNGWSENKAEATAEQSVYYCNNALEAGTDSEPLFTGVKIDGRIASEYTVTNKDGVITAEYDYDGASFCVEAEVQAIQYEHAQEAAGSAWGVKNVTFADGKVTVQ